ADGTPGLAGGAHQQRVGLVHRGHAHLAAVHLQGDRCIATLALAQRQRATAEPAAGAVAAAHAAGAAVHATVADLDRLQPRHQRTAAAAALAAAAAPLAAAVDLCELLGEVLRGDVLELVGEQLHAAAGAVDAFDPLLDAVEVGRLRGDHQHGIGALQRHEAEHPG